MGKILTDKEQLLITEYFRLGSQVKAYKSVYPDKDEINVYKHASRKFAQIRAKVSEREMMEMAGLGRGRFYAKIEELLECTQHFYNKDGIHCGEHPDNRVRFQATQLLGKVLGLEDSNEAEDTENTETVDSIEIIDECPSVEIVTDED